MKTIIAGSRGITDYQVFLENIVLCPWLITCVVSGTAPGVDRLGERWAEEYDIPIDRYPADWARYGRKAAGHIRNAVMAENAEAAFILWDGYSPGTANMMNTAKSFGLKIYTRII